MDKKLVILIGSAVAATAAGAVVLKLKLGKDNREKDLWAAASDQPS